LNSIKPFTYSEPIRGVQVKPLTDDGKKVSILYNGLLSEKGAELIYLHCGYGKQQNWSSTSEQAMERTQSGWEKMISMQEGAQLNFCFKDSQENWDNNDGINWTYRISD
jgi:hypothetical protein